jgi:hypothetical protein
MFVMHDMNIITEIISSHFVQKIFERYSAESDGSSDGLMARRQVAYLYTSFSASENSLRAMHEVFGLPYGGM